MRAHYGADVAAVDAGCAYAGCAGCVAVRYAALRQPSSETVRRVTLKRLGGVLAGVLAERGVLRSLSLLSRVGKEGY